MRKTAALLVTILVTSSLLTLSSTAKASRTIIVPDDYPTITSAIGNASDGDTILVRAGTYNEIQLKTNKTISLIGEGASKTKMSLNPPIINWSILYQTFSGYANPIEIYADNVVISGFTIESTGGNIFIKGNHERLTGNIIDVNVALGGNYQIVANNTLTLTLDPILGIQIGGSYSTICQNTGSGDIGIGDGSYNNVFANHIVGEIGGFGTSTSNLFYGNTVEDSYGVVAGRGDVVARNIITNCTRGVYVPNGFDNVIYGNTIMNTRGPGLAKIEGLNNTFYANYVSNNEIGVQIGENRMTFGMGNTTFYNNDFLNNNLQAQVLVPTLTDYWDYNGQGNFWSDYTGTDANGDGIGDSPYSVGSNESDRYPLTSPFDVSSISVQLPSWANLSIPNPLPAPFFPPLPEPAPSQNPTPAPTGSFDSNAEFKSGMIPGANVKFWYVWINTSGTQVIYYAMVSDVYNPPIINFFGQHFQTANGTDVFVGSTKALLEVYDDENGDGIPQADFTTGQSEILYHLIVNSSVSYDTTPLEKTVEGGVPHYRWGITYKTIDGFLFKADQTGFAFKVNIDHLRFEYDFYIMENKSYTKTTFAMSDLTSPEQANTGPLPSLEGLSLSLLYITSVASPKPYSPYVNGQPYDSATADDAATPTDSGQIMVEDLKAYEFLFDENYTLTRDGTEETHKVSSEAAAATSVPRYLTAMQWVFGNLEKVLNASVLFPETVGPTGNINLDYGASKFLYRICYPTWGGSAITHDPTYVAYLTATDTIPGTNDGNDNAGQDYLTPLVIGVSAAAVVVAVLVVFARRKRHKEASPA